MHRFGTKLSADIGIIARDFVKIKRKITFFRKRGTMARKCRGAGGRRWSDRLTEYRTLSREIRHDRERLAHLSDMLQKEREGSPERVLPLREALEFYRQRLLENLHRCMAEMEEVQAFINRLPESGLRRIFTLRYLEGYTWQKVARALGGYDESAPRKKHDRYLRAQDSQRPVRRRGALREGHSLTDGATTPGSGRGSHRKPNGTSR